MRTLVFILLGASYTLGQTAPRLASADAGNANLLGQKIGPNDLIAVTVYDAPEFTRTLRVGTDGQIILPLMKHTIPAVGLMPRELEARIAEAIRTEELLKDPVVTVTVAEYQSRPITVSGSVRNPITFQAMGSVRLMEAITRAGGLAPEAGKEALVSTPGEGNSSLVRRIPLKPLLDASDPKLDILLEGGDEVRVPPAPPVGRVFVLGNVKNSNSFPIQNPSDSTVLGMLTLAGGLASSAPKEAYIVRLDDTSQAKRQIPIQIKDIVDRKAPDLPLLDHDILYIPNSKKHSTLLTLEAIVGIAAGSAIIANAVR